MMSASKARFIEQCCADLARLGLRSGGVLLVHSALKSFGRAVPGGAETIIAALREAIGPAGTLLMPALSYEQVSASQPFFSVADTPSCVGLIPETFRRQPGVRRSIHPTHSVCGIGPRAAEILAGHEDDETPCGPNSPFYRLPKYQGQILMLGCGLKPNTSMHAIEEIVQPPYLLAAPYLIEIQLKGGKKYTKMYTPHDFRDTIQRYDRVAQILREPELRSGYVANAPAHLIAATALWQTALAIIRKDTLYFVEGTENARKF